MTTVVHNKLTTRTQIELKIISKRFIKTLQPLLTNTRFLYLLTLPLLPLL